MLAALQLRRSPARTSINTQAAQTRGRPSRTRYRKQRRPIRENTRSPRRVERPSSRSTRQNVNQQSASRRPVRESTRSLRRVETPSIRPTRQNVNQRNASLNVGRSVNENEEEDYIYIPNRAGLRLVPTSRHSDSKISKEHEMNTKGIAATSSEMPSFEYDDPVSSPPLIPRGIAAQPLRNKVANDLIKLSRYFKAPDFEDLRCPDCRNIPRMPVTGECGHTRCMR